MVLYNCVLNILYLDVGEDGRSKKEAEDDLLLAVAGGEDDESEEQVEMGSIVGEQGRTNLATNRNP